MSVITITILSVRAIEKMNLVILRNQPGTSARNKKIKWGERGQGGGTRYPDQSEEEKVPPEGWLGFQNPPPPSSALAGRVSQKVTQIASDASPIKMTLGQVEINLGSKAFGFLKLRRQRGRRVSEQVVTHSGVMMGNPSW